ncbi:MAG: ABC transporter ATP-binding protein [Acetivibrio sp.]
MKKEKIEPLKEPWKIWNYWKKEAGTVALITLSGILYNVGMLAGPIYQGKMIDSLLQKTQRKEVLLLALLFVFLIFAVQVFRYIKRFYIRRFANRTSAAMRFMIYNGIVYKNPKEMREESLGSLMTKAISDVEACVEGMRKFTTEVFDTGVLLASYFVALLAYDWKITLAASVFVPVALFIAEKLKKVIYRYTQTYRKTMGKVTQSTYDKIDNAMLYRLYGREKENQKEYEKLLDTYERDGVIANVWENAMQPIYNVIAMAGIVVIITFAGGKVLDGSFTIGVFSTYVSIFTAMAFKASKAAKLFNSVQKAMISWKRIKPYMEPYQEEWKASKGGEVNTVQVRDLHFSYEGEKEMIKGMNLDIKTGEILGVTGPVACGKSTFGKIFLGNYEYRGKIKIGDWELRSLNEKDRSSRISYMGHDPQLLSDTIYENITLGEVGYPHEDVQEMIKMVCFEKDLETMEDGMDTRVGNGGASLSGGQQARIALARTLYHRKKILILDDPFSAIDEKTQQQILKNIKRICKDSIVILISHRLEIFPQFDKVLLMKADGTSICKNGYSYEK